MAKFIYLKRSQFLTSLCWYKIKVFSGYKQEPAPDNDWGRLFTYQRKRKGPRIEHCGKLLFNVPASEKTSIQTKMFCLRDRTQTN